MMFVFFLKSTVEAIVTSMKAISRMVIPAATTNII
jgi:hypothetical protein